MSKFIAIFITFCMASVGAQDENFIRKIFSKELQGKKKKPRAKKTLIQSSSPFYKFDINNDGRIESFVARKRNGEDWLNIHNYRGRAIYRAKLDSKGLNSWLYKISVRNLSYSTRVFILYYYEGSTEYFEFRSHSRVYFLTIDNKDLMSLSLFKGPAVFDEYETFKKDYFLRHYELNLFDYNNDGVKEIVLKYHLNNWIYMYRGAGKWLEI